MGDSSLAKIICFTNDEVRNWNEIVRQAIFCEEDDLADYLEGEWLVTSRPVKDPHTKEVVANNGTEFLIEAVEKDQIILTLRTGTYKYSAYKLSLTSVGSPLWIVDEFSRSQFEADSKALYQAAKKSGQRKDWAVYYEHLDGSAPLTHIYAGTCHKAQGSGYQHVFLCKSDLDKCKALPDQAKLWYVGCSRAKSNLYIG